MQRTKLATRIGAIVAVVGAVLTVVPLAASAGPSAVPDAACLHSGQSPTHGQDAIDTLGSALPLAAARTNHDADGYRAQLLNDPTLWVDACGMSFYVDPAAPAQTASAPATAAPYPYANTFLLHSKPGSQRTIYLDFNGEQIPANSAWANSDNGGVGWVAPPFDTNGVPGTFSNAEQDAIQEIWQRVSEDYAPFNVDVTTQDPGVAAIDRSSASDQVYGTRALITPDHVIGDVCGCGGIAYINVFNDAAFSPSYQGYYQPALIFPQNLSESTAIIAEGVSHEVGHNFGLSHDGTNAQGKGSYYLGQGSWAPIMGASYYHSITQWSKGEYADANEPQDDLAIIATGAPLMADDHGDTRATATVLPTGPHLTQTGMITTRTDKDMFRFQASGPTTIQVNPAPVGPNLDIRADLFDAAGNPITFADPPAHDVTQNTSTGMNASITQTLASGTYYLQVDGVGQGDPLTTGYTDYASLGAYSVDIVTGAILVAPSTLANATRGTAYNATLTASGATAPYSFAVTGGAVPAGLALSSAGVISGTPTGTGTSTFTVTVTDSSVGPLTTTYNGSILVLAGASTLLHTITPARLFDTRDGTGGVPVAKIVGGHFLQFHMFGAGGLPTSGLGTVALNVTVTNPVGPGFITVYPCGMPPNPLTSNVNFTTGQTVPNAVVAPVSAGGDVCFYTNTTTDLLADVSAWTATGSDLHPLTPTRLFDTRDGTGGVPATKVASGTSLTFKVTGKANVPSTVGAVIMNVTVTEASAGGFLTVYPCGNPPNPLTSNVNYTAGQTVPNLVIAPVSAFGTVCFYAQGTTHVLADISAWVATPSDLHPLTPNRLFDTRDGTGGVPTAKILGGHTLTFTVAGHGGTPLTGVGAVALNVTVTDPIGPGFITVYPCGTPPNPLTSNVNFTTGQTVPNAVLAPVSTTGTVCFYVSAGVTSTNLLADISAWFPA